MPRKPQDSHHTRTASGPSLDREPAPRLPHEHDESGDSQVSGPREVIHQAKRDLDAGLVDTDRGPPMDEVYRRNLKRPGRPG
ncbi:MAG: hypothetical protein EPO01_19225 [Aquabacterium sp.]|nr:MAG: hypothetical protein EPO01_19225 [Aquabacterium sp.]